MKKMFLLTSLSLLITCVSYAQTDQAVNANNTTIISIASQGSGYRGGTGVVFNPPRNIEGTVYLYDTWRNNVVIETDKQKFKLTNINFNAKRNSFESKIQGTDSIFSFDFKNINRLLVNNQPFKKVYSPIDGGYKIYEVIAEAGDYAIYKDYYIEIKEGNPNPMLVQTNDKYVMRDSYYVKKGNSFKRLKLKKSAILKSLGSKSKALEEYASANNLSFRNEAELEKIIAHYSTL